MRFRRTLVVLLVAALGALSLPAGALAQGVADQWSGDWQLTFQNDGAGLHETVGPLCCMEVTRISTEQGLALARGTTGDIADTRLQDVVCAIESPSRLYFAAVTPFEMVSGIQGLLPGSATDSTKGARLFLCTDDAPDAIRGHYVNDRAVLYPFIGKVITDGTILAKRGAGQAIEGSLTRFPGDFPGPAFSTNLEGSCLRGGCRQVRARPRLVVTKVSFYNALIALLRSGSRGARLELSRNDSTTQVLRVRSAIDLADGDVVTSYGTFAEVEITRFDGSVVTLSIDPGGSIQAGSDPGILRHRGGRIIEGSATGFTADSEVFSAGPNSREMATSLVRTTSTGGKVALALDPSRKRLTVRALTGRAQVQAGGRTITLAAGAEALATATGVRRLGPPPDVSRAIPSPRTLTAGPVGLRVPRAVSARSLAVARCLATRARASGPATILVTLLTGTAKKGAVVAQVRAVLAAGAQRAVCLRLDAKARALPPGTPLRLALGVRAGSLRRVATAPLRLDLP